MPVQLGQNNELAQFTPELQQKLFERGVNGIDITNGIPRRQPNPELVERMQTLESIFDMVQKGELVPKQNYQPVANTPNQQTYVQQQPVVQNAPVNVQDEPNVQDSNKAQENDIMKMLFPEQGNQAQQVVNPPVAEVPNRSDGTTQAEQPKINWEEVVYEQQNILRNSAVKQGVRGDDLIQWIGQLQPEDYVEMFKAYRSYTPEQQAPVTQNTVQNQNGSLVNWSQNQQIQQYPPSIADLPGANVATVRRDDARPPHPFGLR